MWLAPDLMFGCVIFIVYFGIIKENTRILSFGLRAHIYYSVLCLLRIVYMALKLFACTEHMRSQGIFYCLVYVVERSRVFVVWYLLNMAIAQCGKTEKTGRLRKSRFRAGWSKVPVALPVLIPVPVFFSASAASAAKFHTEKALVLA